MASEETVWQAKKDNNEFKSQWPITGNVLYVPRVWRPIHTCRFVVSTIKCAIQYERIEFYGLTWRVEDKHVVVLRHCNFSATTNKHVATKTKTTCGLSFSQTTACQPEKTIQMTRYKPTGRQRGPVVRTLVFGWRTFPDLCLTYGW